MKDDQEINAPQTPAPAPAPASAPDQTPVSAPVNYPLADLPPANSPNPNIEAGNRIENRFRLGDNEFNVNVPQPNQPEPINPEPNSNLVGAAIRFMERLEENKGQVVEDNNNNANGANIHQDLPEIPSANGGNGPSPAFPFQRFVQDNRAYYLVPTSAFQN